MIKIGNDNLTAVFDEKDGMTCTSINFKGREYVYFDEKRKESGGTYGIPILFPTPNRVRDGFYVYNGKKIVGNRHGRLRHMPFEITGIKENEVIALVRFSSADDDFPYDADFVLSVKVVESSLIWNFEVRNKGDEELAYGLALHPYFMKEENRNAFVLNVNVPVGEIKGVRATRLDGYKLYHKKIEHIPCADGSFILHCPNQPGLAAGLSDRLDADITAVRNGYVSVTPLYADMADHRQLGMMESWNGISLHVK